MVAFALGWPRSVTVNGSDGEWLALAFSPSGALLAGISRRGVCLWSTGCVGHLLGTIEIAQDGTGDENILTRFSAWKESSDTLAVLTAGGDILVLQLSMGPDTDVLAHLCSGGMPEAAIKECTVAVSLQWCVRPPDGKALCLASRGPFLVVGQDSGVLSVLSWSGEVLQREQGIELPLSVALALRPTHLEEDGVEHEEQAVLDTGVDSVPVVDVSVSHDILTGLVIYAFVFGDGRAGLAVEAKSPHTEQENDGASIVERLWGFVIHARHRNPAVRVSTVLNRRGYAAVGLRSGEVLLYRCTPAAWAANAGRESSPDSVPFEFSHCLSLLQWGVRGEDTGPVAGLSFTEDGLALAIAWADRGAAVFSTSGCRCMSTIPQVLHSEQHSIEWLRSGCTAVSWSKDGYKLALGGVTPQGTAEVEEAAGVTTPFEAPDDVLIGSMDMSRMDDRFAFLPGLPEDTEEAAASDRECSESGVVSTMSRLLLFDFFRSAHASNPREGNSLVLQGSDRVILISHRGAQMDPYPEHILYPRRFVDRNWPIMHVAVSSCENEGERPDEGSAVPRDRFVAVAGRHGVAVYSCNSQRWRLFGNIQAEQALTCCGLDWVHDTGLIVANQRNESAFELLLFSPDAVSLHSGVPLAAVSLGSERPLALACDGTYIAVGTESSLVVLFRVNVEYVGSAVRASCAGPVLSIAFDSMLPPLVSLQLLPHWALVELGKREPSVAATSKRAGSESGTTGAVEKKERVIVPRLLVLRMDGTLSAIVGRKGKEVVLATDVHSTWLCESSAIAPLWAYGPRGLQAVLHQTRPDEREPSLPLDAEVYPLGIPPGNGMVTGVCQAMTLPGQTPVMPGRFLLMIRSQPFLHSPFVYFLRQRSEEGLRNAKSVAVSFQTGPHRAHFMELALHDVLECSEDDDEELLHRTVELLRDHDRFPAAVAGCARKSDVNYWPALFEQAGPPADLFDRALLSGDLLAATALVPVLRSGRSRLRDTRLPLARALEWGARGTLLLSALLASGDMQSAVDLLRYLLGQTAAEMHDAEETRQGRNMCFSIVLEQTNEEDVELRYAVDCVIGHRVEQLLAEGSLAELVVLSTSLRKWFLLESWLQRRWRMLRANFDIGTALLTMQNAFSLLVHEADPASGESADMRRSVSRHSRAEVGYLQDLFSKGRAWEWALCAATLLRREEAAAMLLRKMGEEMPLSEVEAHISGGKSLEFSEASEQEAAEEQGGPSARVMHRQASMTYIRIVALKLVWKHYFEALVKAGGYEYFSQMVRVELGLPSEDQSM